MFIVSAILTRLLSDLAGLSTWVAQYLFTLVAAVFLLIPYAILTRTRRDFDAHALTWDGWPRALGWALLATVITAGPFFVGYHYWRTEVLKQRFDFAWDNYKQLPLELEGRPLALNAQQGPFVQLWRDGHRVILTWSAGPGRHRMAIKLTSTDGGELTLTNGRHHAADPQVRQLGQPRASLALATTTTQPRLRHAAAVLRGGQGLRVEVSQDGEVATNRLLRLGPQGLPPEAFAAVDDGGGGVILGRSVHWAWTIILAQFILVALPEEYFYRGYLQTTLDDAMPQRARWWIFHLSPAILITSVLFGVGHFIIDLRPARMSVFFPSLLFGWLRDHTGTILSCVVYHAACNLMVEAATHHYF